MRGREAQFTACEGFTSHRELARGQFRSPDRKPAFSPSPSLRPISSTAPKEGASARAGPGPTLAAPRPGGDLRQPMVKHHASLHIWAGGRGWEGGVRGGPWLPGARGHMVGAATASREGLLQVLRPTSQAPAWCGLLSYKVAKPSSGPPPRSDEGALFFQALGPAGHGGPGPSGTPSWLCLPLVLRCPMGCEDGGAVGMGWPLRDCSHERPQDSILGVQWSHGRLRGPREGCAGRHNVYL